ncbi:MAG: hypothetical protein EPN57_08680 [Paraburkholderia sp.]|nr:MAG: hypothetical protein EPN57_08680 [Paraburkholderia sp.]
MATCNMQTNRRRAGKAITHKEASAQAKANGKTVEVVGPYGVTVHEPGETPDKVPRAGKGGAPASEPGKEKRTAARKTASKDAAKGKASTKVDKTPVEGMAAPAQQEEKRGVGRPSVFRPEFCEMLLSFFRIDLEREVEVTKQDKEGKPVTVVEIVLNRFPTLTRFADSIDVTRQTLHDWATAVESDGATLKHPEFSYAYTRAKDLQESLLIEGGMSGVYEPRFASLASKNLIGWRDQIDQTVTATVTQATTDDLNKLYEDGIAKSRAARKAAERRSQPKATYDHQD